MPEYENITENIRLVLDPEFENYFDVYGGHEDEDADEIRSTIENLGCWHLASQVRCPLCHQWETVDSIGMLIGYENPFQNPYRDDLLESAHNYYNQHKEDYDAQNA